MMQCNIIMKDMRDRRVSQRRAGGSMGLPMTPTPLPDARSSQFQPRSRRMSSHQPSSHKPAARHTIARALVASAFALASLLSVAAAAAVSAQPDRAAPAIEIDSQSFLFN
jgi:hypothetical protein